MTEATKTNDGWQTLRSWPVSLKTGASHERWRALGPWRDTEAEAKDDAERECSACGAELTCRRDCERQLAEKDERIAEIEDALAAERDGRGRALKLCGEYADELGKRLAERDASIARITELKADHRRTLADVEKGRGAYMAASREWAASCLEARKERDAAVKRAEEAESKLTQLEAERDEYFVPVGSYMLANRERDDAWKDRDEARKRLTELTTWRKGAPSEPGWYATRGPNLLAADNWDGVTWLNSYPSESTEYLPIRLDWCAEPAPASPYADEHKPEDTEDA